MDHFAQTAMPQYKLGKANYSQTLQRYTDFGAYSQIKISNSTGATGWHKDNTYTLVKTGKKHVSTGTNAVVNGLISFAICSSLVQPSHSNCWSMCITHRMCMHRGEWEVEERCLQLSRFRECSGRAIGEGGGGLWFCEQKPQ